MNGIRNEYIKTTKTNKYESSQSLHIFHNHHDLQRLQSPSRIRELDWFSISFKNYVIQWSVHTLQQTLRPNNKNYVNKWFNHEQRRISLREECPYLDFSWPVFSRIWTKDGEILECGKIRTRKAPNTDTFHAVFRTLLNICGGDSIFYKNTERLLAVTITAKSYTTNVWPWIVTLRSADSYSFIVFIASI